LFDADGIAFSEFDRYAARYGIEDVDEFDRFKSIIKRLYATWREAMDDKAKAGGRVSGLALLRFEAARHVSRNAGYRRADEPACHQYAGRHLMYRAASKRTGRRLLRETGAPPALPPRSWRVPPHNRSSH
jgi:hypothetical protein